MVKTVMIIKSGELPFDGNPRLLGEMLVLAENASTCTFEVIGYYSGGMFTPILEIILPSEDIWADPTSKVPLVGLGDEWISLWETAYPDGVIIDRSKGGAIGRIVEGKFEPI